MYIHFGGEDIISERFDCNCQSMEHSMRFSYSIDNWGKGQSGEDDKYQILGVELQATWWEQWYKRIWTAIKYIFQKKEYYYCGIDFDKKDDILRMRNFFDEVLKRWKE